MERPLWQPSDEQLRRAQVTAFRTAANARFGLDLPDYGALWRWSVEAPDRFWDLLWDFGGVVAETKGGAVVTDLDRMPGARWFPEARLSFAENLLRRRDDADAIVFHGEEAVSRRLSWAALYDQVSRLAQALRAHGVGPGDRVAGYLPNLPEAVIGMLAASSLGAIWSSCSPDFGTAGVLDRFGQIEPKVLISADGYLYKGRRHGSLDRLGPILAGLPSVSLAIVVPYAPGERPDVSGLRGAVRLEDLLAPFAPQPEIPFARLPFDHPLYIMYSSGTTGKPKCIVHGAGGTLLQHLKELKLHCDVRRDDRVFYFTTCGWMMWNWLVSGLACEATLLLYDGSPFHPGPEVLFDYADAERMTLFGTSAKYIDAVCKSGLEPRTTHSLESVRTITSTGSPLVPESFDFVYRSIKPDVQLASISGGTDIISCFVLGNPAGPVWRGEIQTRGLGMAVAVFDEEGRPLRGRQGELVCTRPFPSMPTGFWNDPEGARYRAAYFERFPGIWHHGDWAELTERDGIVIYGRSDATLNPGGVRIGTAEIYRQVEQLDEVLESIVVGQDVDGDVRVVLFVVLREGLTLDDALRDRIRKRIRDNTTPRHVPAKILQVSDIPRTKSGKITELAVRDVLHGRPVKNREALANPAALDLFRDLAELSGS